VLIFHRLFIRAAPPVNHSQPRAELGRVGIASLGLTFGPLLVVEIWTLDFMSDSLYQGRRFRTLNVLDEGVREALAIEIDTSLPAARVVRTVGSACAEKGS
jgi:hypothetical protein